MAETLVSDVIVPSVFLPYVVERTAELSQFFTSGVIEQSPEFGQLAAGAGQTVNMPFWKDLAGDDQVLSDTGALTTKKITTSGDAAVIHNRGDAWATNDLAGLLAGSDPMAAIGDLVADYWARKTQKMLLSTLKGVFTAASMATNSHDIYDADGVGIAAANALNSLTFLDARQKLGDAGGKLVAIAMHSMVRTSLVKLDLIETIPGSEGEPDLDRFMGMEVIVDDGMTVEVVGGANVYSTYLFGKGALAMGVADIGNGNPIEGGTGTWELEFARNALAGQNIMINRRRFIMHPRGVKWLGASMAGLSPTNVELETGTNFLKVFETKNVRIVRIRHNVL
jgi:hypothetical protein